MTHESKPALFRIGGYYRNGAGELVRLDAMDVPIHADKWEFEYPGHTFAVTSIGNGEARGYVSLVNGRYCLAMASVQHLQSLIPGECDEQGNPLTFYVSAKTLEPQPEPLVCEKLRPRLTWADKSEFDPFRDFQVASDTTEVEPFGGPLTRSPDLEPSSAQVGPAFGSAWLVIR